MSEKDPVHELRNHLSIILGFSELLLADQGLSADRRGDVAEIKQAATRALNLLPSASSAFPRKNH